jgi:nucleotide-binding universal stress UspA family protein
MGSELATPGILVPLDGSPLAEQVLPYAQALLVPGAELTLLQVVEASEPTHGWWVRGALGRWVFGSVADRVARSSPVPVLLMRPQEGESQPIAIRRLIVPLDGSALAEEAVQRAQVWAERLRVPIRLITVFDVLGALPPALGSVVAFDAAIYQETVAQLEADAMDMLAGVSARLDRAGVQSTSAVLHGSPFVAIADAVEDGDLIVMTSHGRSGVRRWLLGSVAEKLIREAPVPVILVPVAARQSSLSATTPGNGS